MDRRITNDDDLVREIKQKLKDNGEKMFLWIHFQILNIWNSDSNIKDNDIRRLIENFPRGLTETYIACLRRLRQHASERSREIAARTFKWLALAKRPLTLRQMQEAVSLDPQNLQFQNSAIVNTPVTEFCANLVATDLTNRTVCFTHASVKTFLLDPDNFERATELREFSIDLVRDNLICADLCLSYLEWLRSRQQIVVRRELNLPGNISQSLLREVSWIGKTTMLSRYLGKHSKVSSPTIVLPVPPKTANEFRLELHLYCIHYWLDHTINISEPGNIFVRFQKFCTSPEPAYFPHIDFSTSKPRLYQSLLYCAVLKGHLPMVRIIIRHIQAEMRSRKDLIFGTVLPGTSSLLIHVAAAVGEIGVIEELQRVSNIMVWDEEGRSPLAWAAISRKFDTVFWLMASTQIDITKCQRIPGPKYVSLLAFMASQGGLKEFWSQLACDHKVWYPCLTPPFQSQAVFAACSAGVVEVAEQLWELGADAMHFSPFAWPGFNDQVQGWPILVFLRRGLVDAAETYLQAVKVPLQSPNDESCTELVDRVLNLPGADAARLAQALCHRKQLILMKTTFDKMWLNIVLRTSSTTGEGLAWRRFVRVILQFEADEFGSFVFAGEVSELYPEELLGSASLPAVIEEDDLKKWTEMAPSGIVAHATNLGYLEKNPFRPSVMPTTASLLHRSPLGGRGSTSASRVTRSEYDWVVREQEILESNEEPERSSGRNEVTWI